ncbi:MAG: hypothetical protein HKL87_08395 [Acidimicrobiaceae bacterium]|nr:hypothetical protein [Acidimicrobiaceae bacterium]
MGATLVRAAFWRGGTSKGLFFRDEDLAPFDDRDEVFQRALGSPDRYGRQLDGMGGGISSLSKVVVVHAPRHPDADLSYTFGQVAVDRALVDYSSNCGNLTSAVAPYAVREGLLHLSDGPAVVRLHNTNTDKIVHVSLEVRDGDVPSEGSLWLPGVDAPGAPLDVRFIDPGASRCTHLLPSGATRDVLDGVEVSLVDAVSPLVVVRAHDLGRTNPLSPDEIDRDSELTARLEDLRRRAAVLAGLAGDPEHAPLAAPKIGLLGPASDYETLEGRTVKAGDYDLAIRMMSMGRAHRAVPVTSALALAVTAQLPGSLAHDLVGGRDRLRLGTPSGVVEVGARVEREGDGLVARHASLWRTARELMRGEVRLGDPRA